MRPIFLVFIIITTFHSLTFCSEQQSWLKTIKDRTSLLLTSPQFWLTAGISAGTTAMIMRKNSKILKLTKHNESLQKTLDKVVINFYSRICPQYHRSMLDDYAKLGTEFKDLQSHCKLLAKENKELKDKLNAKKLKSMSNTKDK
jgi:hypothetical protein